MEEQIKLNFDDEIENKVISFDPDVVQMVLFYLSLYCQRTECDACLIKNATACETKYRYMLDDPVMLPPHKWDAMDLEDLVKITFEKKEEANDGAQADKDDVL